MRLTRHLPNLLTCGNLLCGCIGILYVPGHSLEVAAYFVWAACLFDFLDGIAARILQDSLADMVSFGVLPAWIMYRLLSSTTDSLWLPYVALLLAVCSALRLAKFNIDENQKNSFSGLPTPANALLITSLVFLPSLVLRLLSHASVLMFITLLFSFLLVAPIELFALKFRNFSWDDNKVRFTFLVLSVLLMSLLRAGSIPLIILLYIAISLVIKVLRVQKN
jgi:CDP-diacylglycerol---serine O-phosphatidyltransferase